MKGVGFIGIGAMGASMVRNLKKAGFDVEIYARRPEKAAALTAEGIPLRGSVKELCRGKEFVVTIIGAPKDVEETYLGPDGILESLEAGAVVVDMTTSSPSLAKRIYGEAKKRGILAVDAPVSGGVTGARDATMTIMAGGDEDAFQRCRPLFEAMGGKIFHTGPAGSGQSMKLANQVACAGAIGGLLDVCQYAKSVGLDLEKMFEVLTASTGNSRQMELMYPRLLSGNFEPGFMVKHYVKDLGIAESETRKAGNDLPVTDMLLGMYRKLADRGMEELDFSAVVQYWNET